MRKNLYLVTLLTLCGLSLAAVPRDLVLVTNAGPTDVRAIEATGALVNSVSPQGVTCEASKAEQAQLAGAGFRPTVVTPNITDVYETNFRTPATDGQYLTYAQFRDTMATIATNNSGICRLETLGTSYNGNLLLAMKVSDNPDIHENEPAIHFEGDMHGDEKIGWAVAFEMLKYLVSNYGTDTLVTRLVDTREIWLMPMYNPDGYIAGERYNGNGVDMNRNWGWMWGNEYNQGASPLSEPENRAVMAHIMRNPFVMFVSFHSGAYYISYPWSCTTQETIPEDRLISFLSQRYALYNNYPYGQGSIGMYEINGSTKDWDYGQGMMGWSIEVNGYMKTPPAESIAPVFNVNRPAILEFYHRAGQGIHGVVTDGATGQPVHAQVWVNPANWPSYNDATLGDYHRFYLPGTYSVTFRAPGYRDTTVSGVVVPNSGDSAVTVDMQMTPDAVAPLFGFRVIYIDGNYTYTADPKVVVALGAHDSGAYPLTAGRRLCIDMDKPVHDVTGNDLTVYRPSGSGTATVKGSSSWQGPWTTIGTANSAATEFDISAVGLDSVRYIELTSSGTFNVDAIEGANDYVGVAGQAPSPKLHAPSLAAQSPARGAVRFSLGSPPPAGTRLVIRDASGRLVSSLAIRNSSFVIPLPSPAGVYFAAIEGSPAAPVHIVLTR
jgi:hypothetical protein